MQQLLKLENPKTSSSNLPHFLKHLFSIENPLEFTKQTLNLTKNFTIDEDEKTATLEIEKELKYGALTIEMTEDGELIYSMKKFVRKAGIKWIYDLKPAVQLPIVGLKPEYNFELMKPVEPLTSPLSLIKRPTIPVLDIFTTQNTVPYATNDYMMPFETSVQMPTYQEELNPLKKYQENMGSGLIETNTEPLRVPIDMIMSSLTREMSELDPVQNVSEYKKAGFQIERYGNPHSDHGVYQRVILDRDAIIPGGTALDSFVNAGLDIETSYHKKWGTMMDGVNGIKNDNERYWGLFVNGKAPSSAIDNIKLKKDDDVELVYTEMSEGSCFAGRNITDFYSPDKTVGGIGILGLPEIMYH